MKEIRGLKFTYKGGPESGHHGHAGVPGQLGGSAPGGGSSITSPQRDEIVRELTGRVEWMRGKIKVQWREPVEEPGETQRIHVLGTVDSTASKLRRWTVDDLPELVRHPHSIGKLSMRIGKPIRRRGTPPVVVKFDW